MTVPSGWVAHEVASSTDPTWCFALASPSGAGTADCLLWFRALVQQPSDTIRFGFAPSCDSEPLKIDSVEAGVRTFGGRSANYTESLDTCENNAGTANDVTAYVVGTYPAYALYTDTTTAKVRSALTELAAHSKLPAQVAPLPYYIPADAKSHSHRADGYHVELQPVMRSISSGSVTLTPTGHRIGLVISDSLVTDNGATLVGAVELSTDGWHVTSVTIDGG